MTDTWNPSDHTFTTLSSGNKVATGNNATVGLVRSITSKSSGKIVFQGSGNWTNNNSSLGMCTSAVTLAGNVGGPTPNGGFTVNRNGNVFYNNVILFNIPGWVNNVAIVYAVDFAALLFWIAFGASGLWNGSGTADPATGVGGRSFAGTNTPLFAVSTVGNTDVSTFTSTPVFVRPIPSGYTPYDTALEGVGLIAGTSSLLGVGTGVLEGVGSIAGTSSLIGAGVGVREGVGLIAGTSSLIGIGGSRRLQPAVTIVT